MNGFVAFFKGLLGVLLPKAWQQTMCEFGLLLFFAVGFTLDAWHVPAAKYAFALGGGLAILPLLMRLIFRAYVAFSFWDRSAMERRLQPHIAGRVAYFDPFLTPTDEVVYLVVERTGVVEDRPNGDVPHRVLLLRSLGHTLERQVLFESEGWQFKILLGGDNDWRKAVGLVFDGSRTFAYHLDPSYGNRGANRSAYLEYRGVDEDVVYNAQWVSTDDHARINGAIQFSPVAGVPSALKMDALQRFSHAGFEASTDDALGKEMRAWQSSNNRALRQGRPVHVEAFWNAGPVVSVQTVIAIGSEQFGLAGFRTAAVVRIREDAAWTVVFVGHGFPTLGTDGKDLYIQDVTSVYKYVPRTSTLVCLGTGLSLVVENGITMALLRGKDERIALHEITE